MNDTNIFDGRGMVRSDLENVAPSPERDALIAAINAEKKAEATVKADDAALADAIKAADAARQAMPKSTFLDEWRASVASYRRYR